MTLPLWERERHWPLMRPFVYYLVENFVPPTWISGRRVVDFSAGLGDLTSYLVDQGARHTIATVPEPGVDPPFTRVDLEWRPGVFASRIDESFEAGSVDLFCARMVFQFPRWEDDRVDVDSMLHQVRSVLAPGGRVVIASHTFFPLQNYPSLANERDGAALVTKLKEMAAAASGDVHEILREDARRLGALAEMVQYLGLPPRESSTGLTGYGLRVPTLVDSFIRAGFALEVVDDVEPFTYPIDTWRRFAGEEDAVRKLGETVFSIKKRLLLDERAMDPYERPTVVAAMLDEIRRHVDVVAIPIVRIAAVKA